MTRARTVHVISDLHLGGAPDFRMMSEPQRLADFIDWISSQHAPGECELVINGDFIDFLAHDHGRPGEPSWVPFVEDPVEARACFDAIARGMDAPVFASLAALLARGHRLTILLGNHDIELALPTVREALLRELGALDEPRALRFVHDGEAYVIGDVLIEHGNRYDEFNRVDHERLHHLRVAQTLRMTTGESPFDPPFGSKLVARIMNPIKKDLAFIDLLKPEGPALLGVLLALAPEQRERIVDLLELWREHRRERRGASEVARKEVVYRGGPSRSPAREQAGAEDLDALLAEALGGEVGRAAAPPRMHESVMRGRVSDTWELVVHGGGIEALRMLAPGRIFEVDRLELLRRAIDKLAPPESEAIDRSPYYAAAIELAEQGFRLVVFGHTHGAMTKPIGPHARYINTGTWANLMTFPAELRDPKVEASQAHAVLTNFLADLRAGALDRYARLEPHHAKFRVDEHEQLIGEAELLRFETA